MAPVNGLRTNPGGIPVTEKLVGEPVAAMVYVGKGIPTVPG
jgi:hypothetical protein